MKSVSLAVLSATLILAAIIAALTLGPKLVPGDAVGGDKVQHALGFGAIILPIALLRPAWLVFAAPAVIVGGGVVEILQSHVGRDGELSDWISDIAGVAAMILLTLMLRHLSQIAIQARSRLRSSRREL